MMSKFHLSENSLSRLEGVHPDLVKVVKRAIELTTVDFGVTEGLRTMAEERKAVASGHSQTMHSRHLDGHAVDLMGYENGHGSWHWPLYVEISKAMHRAADEFGVPIEWGGDWLTLKDGAHFQLPWKEYPSR